MRYRSRATRLAPHSVTGRASRRYAPLLSIFEGLLRHLPRFARICPPEFSEFLSRCGGLVRCARGSATSHWRFAAGLLPCASRPARADQRVRMKVSCASSGQQDPREPGGGSTGRPSGFRQATGDLLCFQGCPVQVTLTRNCWMRGARHASRMGSSVPGDTPWSA